MGTPFPGMDPYLEAPGLWPDVHNSLIAALRDELGPRLRPRYAVCIEERAYMAEGDALALVGLSDVAVTGISGEEASPRDSTFRTGEREATGEEQGLAVAVEVPVPDERKETYLEVRAVPSGKLITTVEILSHTNKLAGEGREAYERKRRRILGSATNLVEIDLLRSGERMTIHGKQQPLDYYILVSRAIDRPRACMWTWRVRQPVPAFDLPLRPEEEQIPVALGPILHALYDRASYDLRIDYGSPPAPRLRPADEQWADGILRAAGFRNPG